MSSLLTGYRNKGTKLFHFNNKSTTYMFTGDLNSRTQHMQSPRYLSVRLPEIFTTLEKQIVYNAKEISYNLPFKTTLYMKTNERMSSIPLTEQQQSGVICLFTYLQYHRSIS